MEVSKSIGNIILRWYFLIELQMVEEFLFHPYSKSSSMFNQMIVSSPLMDKHTWSHS
jgi:hypothetical protein